MRKDFFVHGQKWSKIHRKLGTHKKCPTRALLKCSPKLIELLKEDRARLKE